MTTALQADRWVNRRKMAWICLTTLVAMVPATLIAAVINPEAVKAAGPLLSALAISLAGIVGVYTGFATAHDAWSKEG